MSTTQAIGKNTLKQTNMGRAIGRFVFLQEMGVSKNKGTPKSSILIGFSIINHPFWCTPVFGSTQIKEACHHSTLPENGWETIDNPACFLLGLGQAFGTARCFSLPGAVKGNGEVPLNKYCSKVPSTKTKRYRCWCHVDSFERLFGGQIVLNEKMLEIFRSTVSPPTIVAIGIIQ